MGVSFFKEARAVKSFILSICLILTAFGVAAAEVRAQSLKEPLRIAYSEYMPFYFQGSAGEHRGILVDFWNLWSKKTGVEISFKTMSWKKAIQAVRKGKADIGAAHFYTAERDQYLDFSQPFFDLTAHIYSRKDSAAPKKLKDLAGYQVGVVSSDYNLKLIRNKQPKAILREYSSHERLVMAAIEGEVEAFVMETPVAMTYLAKHQGLKIIRKSEKPVYSNQFLACVSEGQEELLQKVNKGIAAISDQEVKGILNS